MKEPLILLIDDNEVSNFFHTRNVKKAKFHGQFVSFLDIEQSLIFLGKSEPDIVILNCNVKGFDDVVKSLRTKSVKALMLLNTEDEKITLSGLEVININEKDFVHHLKKSLFENFEEYNVFKKDHSENEWPFSK